MIYRLEWMIRYREEIEKEIKKLELKENQGVVDYDTYFGDICYRKDNYAEYTQLYRIKENKLYVSFIETQVIPLYVGKIVSIDHYNYNEKHEFIDHIIGDLYFDTLHLIKFWKIKKKINRFFYLIKWYYRYRIKKYFKQKKKHIGGNKINESTNKKNLS